MQGSNWNCRLCCVVEQKAKQLQPEKLAVPSPGQSRVFEQRSLHFILLLSAEWLEHWKHFPSLHLDILMNKVVALGKLVRKVHAHLNDILTLSNKSAELHSGWWSLLEREEEGQILYFHIFLTEFLHTGMTYFVAVVLFNWGLPKGPGLPPAAPQQFFSHVVASCSHRNCTWFDKFSTVKFQNPPLARELAVVGDNGWPLTISNKHTTAVLSLGYESNTFKTVSYHPCRLDYLPHRIWAISLCLQKVTHILQSRN